MSDGWIGVDLDGTLAYYSKWVSADHVGEPVPAMLDRVKKWLAEGKDVRIFTARVSHDGSIRRMNEAALALETIRVWCRRWLGCYLPVTCTKDFRMVELWDDRAVQVEQNTGRALGRSTRGN